MMDKLEPCPFCGGAAEWLDLLDITESDQNCGGSVIQCTKCNASSHVEFGYKENLASIWNTRAAAFGTHKTLEDIARIAEHGIVDGHPTNALHAVLHKARVFLESTNGEPNAN